MDWTASRDLLSGCHAGPDDLVGAAGSVFGITIKVQYSAAGGKLLGLILKAGLKEERLLPSDVWGYSAGLMALLFLSVLLHEFGHSFAARALDGRFPRDHVFGPSALAFPATFRKRHEGT